MISISPTRSCPDSVAHPRFLAAFAELRPALVRRDDELHENGGALTTFEPAF